MIYLNERILLELGIDWNDLINVIHSTTKILSAKETAQPIKPYLRFKNLTNRIIAMPAYVGGDVDSAGIKWIASFPENITKSIKRAHAVLILNDTNTGAPIAIINTGLISGIRTASVSGYVLSQYVKVNDPKILDCGIIGFGPIGQLHAQMLLQSFDSRVRNIYVYDKSPIDEKQLATLDPRIIVCSSWEEVYDKSNLFITCTVSSQRYVNRVPKKGGIYLNVSLRDFEPDFLKKVDMNVVDNWEEICRENTDIEHAHLQFGLDKKDVLEITDIINPESISGLNQKVFMFNPMGMAIYDIAVAKYYHDLAKRRKNFVELEN